MCRWKKRAWFSDKTKMENKCVVVVVARLKRKKSKKNFFLLIFGGEFCSCGEFQVW